MRSHSVAESVETMECEVMKKNTFRVQIYGSKFSFIRIDFIYLFHFIHFMVNVPIVLLHFQNIFGFRCLSLFLYLIVLLNKQSRLRLTDP